MSTLNAEQLEAVNCKENKILCLAGAGTGKTYTMIERICRLVNEGVYPESILVLTFTNVAAAEMKSRYMKVFPDSLVYPEFRTFHSFCYNILSTNKQVLNQLGYNTIPSVATETAIKKLYRDASVITNIKTSFESLQKKKNLSNKEQYEYNVLRKTIDKLSKKLNIITFDALCYNICDLFTIDHESISSYKQRFQYIFVDEFQDTDPKQYEFIESFNNSHIFVVGDALQAIYSFRGADSSIIKKLSKDPSWHVIRLFQNYRSSQEICDFANKHSDHAEKSYRIDITSNKQEGDVKIVPTRGSRVYGSINNSDILFCVYDIASRNGTSAILCRTNREVDTVKSELIKQNIEISTLIPVAEIQGMISCILDETYKLEFLSSYLPFEKYAQYLRVSTLYKTNNETYTIDKFISDFKDVSIISDKLKTFECIESICADSNEGVIDKCNDILKLFDYPLVNHVNHSDNIELALIELQDILPEIYSNRLQSSIHVGTIHSVKGLEFDNVYVLGVNDSAFKINNEDNKNLYYVAITRAKSHLVVFEKEQ